MNYLVAYATGGVVTTIWFLILEHRTRKHVRNCPDATQQEKEASHFNTPLMVAFTLTLWWVAIIIYNTDSNDDNDPQSRVPPKFR